MKPDLDATTTHADLERRVHRLEHANRRLVGAVCLLGALALLAAAAPRQSRELVQARRIQLVDDAGAVRIDLRHDASETGLFVLDDEGDTRLGAAHFAHGGSGYALHGPGARGAAVLYLSGEGSLTFYDADGGVTARYPPTASDR